MDWFNVDAVIGGFHFSKLPLDDKLNNYANFLKAYKTDFYTCHCTGYEQYKYMKNIMPRLNYISTGDIIVI